MPGPKTPTISSPRQMPSVPLFLPRINPFIRAKFAIAASSLTGAGHDLVVIRVLDIRPGEMLKWTTFFNVGLPLLIGSLFLAAAAVLFFYFVLLAILKARHSRNS
jgi:hypothetical protein